MYKSANLSSVIFSVMLIGLFLMPWSAGAGDLDREKKCTERDVTIDQVPAAVKAAILEAAGSHEIRELEEVTRPDGIVYEAEWMVDGKEVEIEVASDGTVLDSDEEEHDDVDDNDDEDNDDES